MLPDNIRYQLVPGTQEAYCSPHTAGTGLLWGTGREAPRNVIPSTGTPPSNTGGPEKDGGSAFVPGPHAQTSCLQQRKGKGRFFHSCHHFSPHLHPGCSGRDRRLQWLIADVPTRGHCDIKESQTARHRRGPWAPAPTAAQGLHGASALLQGWKLRPPR